MAFAVGDKVIVTTTRFDRVVRKQSGLTGIIYDIVLTDSLSYKVRFDDDRTNSYALDDLALLQERLMEDTRDYLDVVSR